MYQCHACQAVFEEPDVITEESLAEEMGDDIGTPEEWANALESVGTERCPECFSYDSLEQLGG